MKEVEREGKILKARKEKEEGEMAQRFILNGHFRISVSRTMKQSKIREKNE